MTAGPEWVYDEETVTLGRVLAAARKASGLSLDEVASKLRLEPRFVAALEEERWELFVAPVFVKGHLRQLGYLYGLKYEALLALYLRDAGVADVRHRPVPRAGTRRRVRWGLLIGGLIAIAGIAAYIFAGMGGNPVVPFPDWIREAPLPAVEPAGSGPAEPESGFESGV